MMKLNEQSHGCYVFALICLTAFGCNQSQLVLRSNGGASGTGGRAGSGGADGAAGRAGLRDSGVVGGMESGDGGVASRGGAGGEAGSGGDDAWEPAIHGVQGTGWQRSEKTLCPHAKETLAGQSVWADERGVFAVVRSHGDGRISTSPDTCSGGGCARTSVFFNGGDGWQEWFSAEDGVPGLGANHQLRGLEQGALFLTNTLAETDDSTHRLCMLGRLSQDGASGVHASCDIGTRYSELRGLFSVGASLAYAIVDGNRVIRYDGARWGDLPAALPYDGMRTLWANESELLAGGRDGTLGRLENGEWRQHDTGTLETIDALWQGSPNDIWAGTAEGSLLHYDGMEWQSIAWEPPACEHSIKGMWGSQGVLYFYTDTGLFRVGDAPEVETVVKWQCTGDGANPRIRDIWGRGPNEVFIAVSETLRPRPGCGSGYMLWYDGEELRWF